MMYFLHRFHHFRPGEIYDMLPGEKQILFAFMKYELEQRIKENSPSDE